MKWAAIKGYVGRYAVSDAGDVLSMDYANTGLPGLLSPEAGRYLRVELYDAEGSRWHSVHRLVAAAFIGPANGLQVNHKDGDRHNNAVSNLEYCTGSENMRHAFAIGLQDNRGERHSQSKLTEADVLRIRELIRLGLMQTEIARGYGVNQSVISKIKSGKAWPHLVWEPVCL